MGSESNFECCFDEETNIEDAIMGNGCPFIVNYIGCIEIVRYTFAIVHVQVINKTIILGDFHEASGLPEPFSCCERVYSSSDRRCEYDIS